MRRTKHYPLSTEKLLEAQNLSAAELRMVVANYYQAQRMRKTMDMQLRHLGDKEPLAVTTFAAEAFADIEDQIAKAFNKLLTSPVAFWIKAQRGLGPIIAAGLIAHIDIERSPTVGHIWSFAGLNPDMKWGKGEKRPYNPELKQVCWHAGQCFMKQSNDPDCFYGRIYRKRKEFEIARNEAGGNAEKARTFIVKDGASKAVKDKLKSGKLPDFNIDARARRYAVKIFLSHLHAVMFWDRYGVKAPLPYSLAMLKHAHFIDIPHADMFPGLEEGLRERAGHVESTVSRERAVAIESTAFAERAVLRVSTDAQERAVNGESAGL